MKYYTRLKLHKSSNNVLDLENQSAVSYGHWLYWTVYEGVSIFNNSRYSVSTSKHQREARSLIELTHHVDLVLKRTTVCLSNPLAAINNELDGIALEVSSLCDLVNKKGTRKAKNEERRLEIKALGEEFGKLRSIYESLQIKEVL